jgi:uncharacterized protein YecE (DUF72 family)
MPLPSQQPLFQTPDRPTRLRVGPAGWHYPDWDGTVYPPSAGSRFDHLGFLADYFDTVEINSSFYAPPKPQDAARWAERVRKNPRFRFTAKAWQKLTHELRDPAELSFTQDCDTVRRALSPLAETNMLGAVLLQFPWSFRNTGENTGYLERLFRTLRDFALVLEVRHSSWNDPATFALLRDSSVGFCNIDQPVIGASLNPTAIVTSRVGYFRLHGRNYATWFKEEAGRDARYDYLYLKPEIREITGLVRKIEKEAGETYTITNNHFRGQAIVNAIQILEELDPVPPAIPPQLISCYPGQFAERPGKRDGITG